MYTTIHIHRRIIHSAVARGASLDALCDAIGVDPSELDHLTTRVVGAEPVVRLWVTAEAAIGDRLLGLHIGEEVTATVIGITGYLMNSSPTVAEAFRTLVTYQRQITGWVDYSFELGPAEGVLSTRVNPLMVQASPGTARHIAHMGLSTHARVPAALTTLPVVPLRAEVAHLIEGDLPEMTRVLRCPVIASASGFNRIHFRRADLDAAVLSYDRSLHRMFRDMLEEHERRSARRETFADRVKAALISEFSGQVPAVSIIAAHLRMGPRTFQRKLEEENASYRTIGQEVRKEFAMTLLKNSTYTIDHVADLLGYADASSFNAAFKQWTGTTPGSLRR
ncbi:MAG TPA: AraC family transcriptional regulator ligand-binding domain-containing protein [Flavobacteriales bacterium]|nr:AraC family transcriptional regulator ligand-binding domain-containing protein [Flavobacteriales bacterium]